MSKELLICVIVLLSGGTSRAAQINDEQAVRCLMGEARGEEYIAIVAHAEAYRNRFARYGKLWGVDGCRSDFDEPAWVWAKVRKAWFESATTHLVDGADHWIADYIKKPYWTKNATTVVKIGKTIFYKNVK